MKEKAHKQMWIAVRKTLRVDLDADVIRLAKSKAAGQDVSMWWIVERLLAAWVRGDIRVKAGAGVSGKPVEGV